MRSPITALRYSSRLLLLVLACGLLVGALVAPPVHAASTPVVIAVGDSRPFAFSRMTRVAVTDPQIADVIVSTWTEVIIVAKSPGKCKVYVWDKQGRHDFAVVVKPGLTPSELQRHLQEISLPQWNFQYKILDYKTLYVHSTVMTDEEKEAVDKLLKDVPSKEQVNLIYLIEYATPAARQAVVLRKLVPTQYGIVVWDSKTIMIVGQASSKDEVAQLDQLAKSASTGGLQVVNLVSTQGSVQEAPVAEMAAALGKPYRVWLLHGRTVVVEGIAADQAAMDRVTKLLEAYKDQADVVNLVRVSEVPGVPLDEQRVMLQQALGDTLQVRTVADRALVVTGNVPDEASLDAVKKIISVFEKTASVMNLVRVVAPGTKQVMVHVRVLDVRKTALDKLGINWGELVPNDGAWQATGDNPELGTAGQSWLFGMGEGAINNVFQVGFRLNALKQTNDVRELATPNLLVNDGETADMLVGGEVPIPVPQSGTGGLTVTISYKQYGVLLTVKPQIMENNMIRLMIQPEVSSIDKSNSVSISGFNIPGFVTRRERTVTDIRSGDTLGIGGLLQTTGTDVINKVPLLGDLPILGALFRNKEYQEGKTELVILVTPEIMDTSSHQ